MAHDVFISYSSTDKATADAMCATLESRSIRCWIAPRDVLPGMDYGEALIDALNESKILVLIFSSNSNNSPQVMREVERAVSKGIAIIPFRIEDVPPSKKMEYFISSPHWLDALTTPLEMHLNKLADTIQAMMSTSEGANSVAENINTGNKLVSPSVKSQSDRKFSRNWIAGILGGVVVITVIVIALNFNTQKSAVKTIDNKAPTANQSNSDSQLNPATANQSNNSSQPNSSSANQANNSSQPNSSSANQANNSSQPNPSSANNQTTNLTQNGDNKKPDRDSIPLVLGRKEESIKFTGKFNMHFVGQGPDTVNQSLFSNRGIIVLLDYPGCLKTGDVSSLFSGMVTNDTNYLNIKNKNNKLLIYLRAESRNKLMECIDKIDDISQETYKVFN